MCHSEAVVGTLMTKKTCYRLPPKPAADAKTAESTAAVAKSVDAKPAPSASND